MSKWRQFNRKYQIRYRAEYVVAVVLVYGMRALSPRFAWNLMRGVGRLMYRMGVRKKVVDDNLDIAFPDKSPEERKRIALAMMDHFSSLIIDVLFQRRMLTPSTYQRRVHISGWMKEYLDQHGLEGLQRRAHGVLFLTGHVGNWEVMPGIFKMMGVSITPIYRRPSNPFVDKLLRDIRLGQSTEVVERRGAVAQMIERFEAGGNVGILFDQEAIYGLQVPFFGRYATCHKTPAALVRDHGVKVALGATLRRGDMQYETIGRLLNYEEFKTDDRDADLKAITADLMQRLEELIREEPEQYFWLHRRWGKRGPPIKVPPKGAPAPKVEAGGESTRSSETSSRSTGPKVARKK
ncbi:MAG: hypothetical protein V3T86_12960 [Planctomycetota bacterium]